MIIVVSQKSCKSPKLVVNLFIKHIGFKNKYWLHSRDTAKKQSTHWLCFCKNASREKTQKINQTLKTCRRVNVNRLSRTVNQYGEVARDDSSEGPQPTSRLYVCSVYASSRWLRLFHFLAICAFPFAEHVQKEKLGFEFFLLVHFPQLTRKLGVQWFVIRTCQCLTTGVGQSSFVFAGKTR